MFYQFLFILLQTYHQSLLLIFTCRFDRTNKKWKVKVSQDQQETKDKGKTNLVKKCNQTECRTHDQKKGWIEYRNDFYLHNYCI